MYVTPVFNLPPLPSRPAEAHKGTFGKVMVVAGSTGMSGAAILAGLGALRGGAGLVYVALPTGIQGIVATSEPSYLTIPLTEDSAGRIADVGTELIDQMNSVSACGIGPGLGRSEVLNRIVQRAYEQVTRPVVVDADALNALAAGANTFPHTAGPRVMTPHPGECSRLLSIPAAEVQKSRSQAAIELARRSGACVVLKGAGTIVTDGVRHYVNTTGNSGLATGGSGDVLTGLITALLAQDMSPFEAAQLGVYLHGLAGDLAAEELSQPGLIASDLPRFLGKAWKQAGAK